MKKKLVHHAARHAAKGKASPKNGTWLVIVQSWMFVVMLALMLGVGTIVGTYINQQMEAATPAVAGVQIEAQ